MQRLVARLKELTAEEQKMAGGKGGMLAYMIQQGYPVPDGLVILPSAFENETLTNTAGRDVRALLDQLRGKSSSISFAVRSSALSEDSASTSFAGEFETVLNAITDEEIFEAITEVYRSRLSDRVKAYSAAHKLDNNHEMAVVVQQMVEADFSGVLFTADPVSGSYQSMVGNYVYGLGENLVSGETDAEPFSFKRPKGAYSGPEDLKKYARQLFKYAWKLEKAGGYPQDIEWSVAGDKLFLLQSRPITTLTAGNLDTYEINESLTSDTLWVNTNIAEAVPDVITPLSWSLTRSLDLEVGAIPGYYIWSGNICGRVYSNIGQRFSAIVTIGVSLETGRNLLGQIFGKIPEQIDIPLYPFSFKELMSHMLPRVFYTAYKMITTSLKLNRLVAENPGRCHSLTARIEAANSLEALKDIWDQELAAYNKEAWWIHTSGAAKLIGVLTLQNKLKEMSDDDIAADLMSNLRGEGELASLEVVFGASRVARGEQSLDQYLSQYGHRGPHEFELALPQPSEDPDWIQKQIEEYRTLNLDIEAILKRQQQNFTAAKEKFLALNPSKEKWLNKRLQAAAEAAQRREICRSEWTRVYRINRTFALKAGELTGLGEDIFFLYKNELIELLAGNNAATSFISDRKKNYERYKALPPFPPIIRGRFDPFLWANDPMRRTDFYDPNVSQEAEAATDKLVGIAGAAGRVEGKVRIILKPEDSDQLQLGEILVAMTTNVGWTPLFPKAAAIITDIGAPLSHAAIVARELGIPAVVGCGNATSRLNNGDRVIVDGGRGEVLIVTTVRDQ